MSTQRDKHGVESRRLILERLENRTLLAISHGLGSLLSVDSMALRFTEGVSVGERVQRVVSFDSNARQDNGDRKGRHNEAKAERSKREKARDKTENNSRSLAERLEETKANRRSTRHEKAAARLSGIEDSVNANIVDTVRLIEAARVDRIEGLPQQSTTQFQAALRAVGEPLSTSQPNSSAVQAELNTTPTQGTSPSPRPTATAREINVVRNVSDFNTPRDSQPGSTSPRDINSRPDATAIVGAEESESKADLTVDNDPVSTTQQTTQVASLENTPLQITESFVAYGADSKSTFQSPTTLNVPAFDESEPSEDVVAELFMLELFNSPEDDTDFEMSERMEDDGLASSELEPNSDEQDEPNGEAVERLDSDNVAAAEALHRLPKQLKRTTIWLRQCWPSGKKACTVMASSNWMRRRPGAKTMTSNS